MAEKATTHEDKGATGKKKFNIMRDFFGGQFLTNSKILSQWAFILYVFLLIMIYISINMGVERTQIKQLRNQRELVNLKAEYTGKQARLQYMSKRGEIATKLKELGSTVKNPESPARVLILDNE